MARMLYPVLAAVALHAVLLAAWIAAFHGDPSGLVCVKANLAGKPPFEAVRHFSGEDGFDGQWYYAIACNPWQRGGGFSSGVGGPYRHQRIVFPALAWLFSGGGQRQLLLWVFPLLNLAAVGGLTYLGVRAARHFGRNEWWALLLPLAVNAAIPMMRDLTDLVAIFAVAGLLIGWLLNWPWWSLALWAAAAVFSREQNAAVIGLAVGAALWTRRYRTAWPLAGILALWGGWLGVMRLVYGHSPFLQGGVFEPPLSALWQCVAHSNVFTTRPAQVVHLAYMSGFLAQMLICCWMVLGKGDRLLAAIGVMGVLFAALAGWTFTYNDPWSYARIFAWIPLVVWLNGMRQQQRWALLTTLPAMLYPLLFLYWQMRN